MKKYIVIHNLNSRGKNLSKDYIENLLNAENIDFEYFATKSIDDLKIIIEKYSDSNMYQYCAIGGDGSLNSLVNALMINRVPNPQVACLPAGSGSDFIRTFALPQDIEKSVKHLNSESYYEIDVGKVEIGQKVSIKVSAYRDRQFFGKVAKIEPLAKVEQNVTLFPILIDIENKENLLLLGMNTDVIIQILDESVSLSIPTSSLRTRKDIKSAAALLEMPEEQVNTFLKDKVKGESFNKFIVIKDSKIGPELKWVQIGKSDLTNVEVINGLDKGDQVFVLPSQSLVDYQEKFRARVSSSFGA